MTDRNVIPGSMAAVVLTGHGGIEKLEYREDVPTPRPGPGEVLLQVTATAKNNTDRKAREGLYPTRDQNEVASFAMGGAPTLTFPRIQGADVVGRIVAVGEGVDPARIGERGLLDFNIYPRGGDDINLTPDYYGHGADGGFAEYIAVPSAQFHQVDNPELADAELASLGMCSYQTALQRFLLESPAGKVQIEARVVEGVVEAITCGGLPSYIESHQARIQVPALGEIGYSVAYSGGFYALVDAGELGFALLREEEAELARCAHAIVEAIGAERGFSHYTLGDVGPLPFLHFMGPVEQVGEHFYRSRSATYVHPGVICRSTTGTGTSARLALLHHEGRIKPGDKLETVSLRDTGFIGELTAVYRDGVHDVAENTITGRGYVLARSDLLVNFDDPMVDCRSLHHILTDDSFGV